MTTSIPDHHVVVIGSGVGGLCAGVRLKQAGIEDFVIVDRAADLGGTWRDNVYPGIAVDIPSVIYQYSFFRNPQWSRVFAPGDEVQAYHQRVAESFGLHSHFRFGVDVRSEEWDEEHHHWRLNLAGGSVITARFVVSAIGPFFDPKQPDIKGIESFAGTRVTPVQWLPEHDVRGKRVAVIGTGATGVQLSGAIADDTASLTVFQRTPVYCIPKPDFRIPAIAQWALRIPGLASAIEWGALVGGSAGLWFLIHTPGAVMRPLMRQFDRAGRALYGAYLRAVVKDKRVARDLLPSFGPLGNRPTLNSDFPRVFNKPHCSLVTTPIAEVVPEGVRTVDGTVHEADFLITATGFDLFSEPASYKRGRVVGAQGRDLGEFFDSHGMRAYESVSITGFPNRWIIVGPYSWTGNGGWHGLADTAVTHIVRAISLAGERRATRMEVRQEALDRFHQLMLRNGRNLKYYFTELNHNVRSYWKNADDDVPLLRPTTTLQARRAARNFPAEDYAYEQHPASTDSTAAVERSQETVLR
ncbi:flavin-containing monooxygenase [Mycobacteroides saopaulense]|uniref:Monooxygenase n=1 Tax=Mycobacteroides saopaulense TaxID=1578165 RepID=A0ABX3C495_9MYCO|nr:NAD(P)/FAD-dependent oxidoreductase [Mycobacteroides saopaulense]OHT88559.1 monooxygenase [Mycobacteroides saopaulense]OHU13377.1 monooxygenase [Mycobacteroides saopaulense]